jgi:hypothetical protein
LREISALKNSLQSRFSSIFTEPDPPQPLDARDALLETHGGDVRTIEGLRLREAPGHPHDPLDHRVSMSPAAGAANVPRGPPRSHENAMDPDG